MNELAGQCLGGYELEEEIGRGSMGMVYRGKQIALGREVAIKVLSQALAKDASYVARFIREAQIIAGLNHPNIVQIFDAGQQNGLLYFVMEYVQGPSIASLLQLDGAIPQYLAAEYGAQIADALDAAYTERNVIHRDIKPENLMLDRWGKIKVMDFGLARAIGLQKITVAKTLVGSIYYASPEQVWGYTLDNRSDIYALGVVLYEMVSGQRPFSGRSLPELTQAIVNSPVRPPSSYAPELSPELEQIILVAMARDRDDRYEQAMLLSRDLRALNLKPTPSFTQTAGPPSSTNGQRPAHGKIVIHPPKRPQMQPPRYLELENTQPPVNEPVANSPAQPVETSQTPASSSKPTASQQASIESSPHSEPEIDTEGPTGPLAYAPPTTTLPPQNHKSRERKRKTPSRQPFWQKLFKPPH
jgi:serine/threonine protein kinase